MCIYIYIYTVFTKLVRFHGNYISDGGGGGWFREIYLLAWGVPPKGAPKVHFFVKLCFLLENLGVAQFDKEINLRGHLLGHTPG